MLTKILSKIAGKAQLVAVSKTHSPEKITALYKQGQRIFGENRIQELVEKQEYLPKDIDWHMIGHLQTNKVKYIAPFIGLIHAVDSFKLMKEINKQGRRSNRVIKCLLQFKIAEEDSKYGLTHSEAKQILDSEGFKNLDHIKICGVMGMATFTNDEQQVRTEFAKLKRIYEDLKKTYFSDETSFKEISMGMSGDYEIALEEGSTMVRIGSLIFGPRD